MSSPEIIGIFGAGHYGQTIATELIRRGQKRHKILLSHGGSMMTQKRLKDAGLADLVVPAEDLCSRSDIVFYLVQPKNFRVISDYYLQRNCLFVSCLAGIPLAQIPIKDSTVEKVRIMSSAPDTLVAGQGIAGTYPANNERLKRIYSILAIQEVPLANEEDMHAFAAFGICLPIALTYWNSLGKNFDEISYKRAAEDYELPNPSLIIDWAHNVQQSGLNEDALQSYLNSASTPGGITEAVVTSIKAGKPLHVALENGFRRSKCLAK